MLIPARKLQLRRSRLQMFGVVSEMHKVIREVSKERFGEPVAQLLASLNLALS